MIEIEISRAEGLLLLQVVKEWFEGFYCELEDQVLDQAQSETYAEKIAEEMKENYIVNAGAKIEQLINENKILSEKLKQKEEQETKTERKAK